MCTGGSFEAASMSPSPRLWRGTRGVEAADGLSFNRWMFITTAGLHDSLTGLIIRCTAVICSTVPRATACTDSGALLGTGVYAAINNGYHCGSIPAQLYRSCRRQRGRGSSAVKWRACRHPYTTTGKWTARWPQDALAGAPAGSCRRAKHQQQ